MNIFHRPADDPRNRPGLFEFICDIDGKPFAAMLNKALLSPFPNPEYSWIWIIQLACMDIDPEYEMPTEAELEYMNNLSIKLFEVLDQTLEVLFVGTTVHRNNFEMMFLGKPDAVAQIGGAVYGLPENLPEAASRFLQFKSEHDPEWSQISGVYQVVRQIATPE